MRDIREKNWFWIENILIDRDDLNAYEKLLYMTLARYADSRGKAFPGLDLLMKNTGIGSKRTLVKHLKGLEAKGLVTIIKNNGKSNTYYLNNAGIVSQEEPGADLPLASEITSVKNTTTPGADLPLHQCQKCHPKKTHLEKQNKKTHLEKINKKENQTDILLNFVECSEMKSERKEILREWIIYKKHKNQYKNTKSLEILIRRFSKYSDEEFRDIVEKSIMNNYAGLFEPASGGNNGNNNYRGYSQKQEDKHSKEPDYTKGFDDWN